ncbi:hypothetical protein SLEP1_g12808 [Rubroshorea leprosula]|uniref:Transmembrane protein n=1 Tax=Rubroshorea leprosula TaxID=152421 RepID=A0AAV5IQ32_9ROSI|nr:hypothetical protein SLEP1_g12808 [Rubroshorea leprosula]
MESIVTHQRIRSSSFEKLVAIGLTILAVVSPLYVNRQAPAVEPEEDEQPFNLSSWLPLLLLVLILAIILSHYLDQSFDRFDPYSIHRVGGSSCGIILILLVLAFVLKFRAVLLLQESF